ncbi:hypothetical protein H6G96_32590 [Nostoc sp. FACHB-892]|uniref:hypothetical protein n=1 Tax=Nostoc sp. FACHB-892 TaxID=2692843 RepID=UPI0016826403|nr:hypothetical protein [Nostoc sp. FACHB-892]MBD2730931.1 hypothetical protein [Nostoc sp. FACHB-892]
MAAEFLKPQILAIASSLMLVGGLCSLRSPLMPVFGVMGTAASSFYLAANPTPNRRLISKPWNGCWGGVRG